jgi:large subunit ribosomal protein L32
LLRYGCILVSVEFFLDKNLFIFSPLDIKKSLNNTQIMPHPKRRKSKSKRDKRRAHNQAIFPQLNICILTKQIHLSHRAYWHEGVLFYRGQVIYQKADYI